MDHIEVRKNLSAHLDHALSVAEQRKIEEHLNGCPSCRQELAELKQVVGAIREIPPEEPPPWLTTRIMARVREESATRPGLLRRLFYPLHIKIPLEAAALVCLCVTGYFLATSTAPELTPLSSQPPAVQELPPKPVTRPPASPETPPLPAKSVPMSASPPAPSADMHISTGTGATAPDAWAPQAPAVAPQPPSPPLTAPLKTLPTDAIPPGKPLSAPKQDVDRAPDSMEKRAVHKELMLSEKDTSMAFPVHLVIRTDDPSRAERDIEEAGSRLGVTVLRRESTPAGRTVIVRLPANRFPALLTRLELLGAVTERPALAADVTGELFLTIRLEATP